MAHPPTQHPSWCSPPECDAERDGEFGAHRSAPLLFDLGVQVFTDVPSVRVQLAQQQRPWRCATYVTVEAGRARVTLELSDVRNVLREVGALLAEATTTEGNPS